MPSGVEHTICATSSKKNKAPSRSSMPSGVEHSTTRARKRASTTSRRDHRCRQALSTTSSDENVNTTNPSRSSMPSGVEHSAAVDLAISPRTRRDHRCRQALSTFRRPAPRSIRVPSRSSMPSGVEHRVNRFVTVDIELVRRDHRCRQALSTASKTSKSHPNFNRRDHRCRQALSTRVPKWLWNVVARPSRSSMPSGVEHRPFVSSSTSILVRRDHRCRQALSTPPRTKRWPTAMAVAIIDAVRR